MMGKKQTESSFSRSSSEDDDDDVVVVDDDDVTCNNPMVRSDANCHYNN